MRYKSVYAICHICTGSGIVRRQRYNGDKILIGSGAYPCPCRAGEIYRCAPLGRPKPVDKSPG